ncbi:hypothetical protein [Chryseobacterium jejuense]|uniref:hypothetical protein n=1 Tax=Chryseobacterium jejuense TaxID=445960 RepID=UPI001AE2B2F5|nr:hypothetical protein [Chryseobacterium jejuense]MBP2617885.1 hypothetical protein [Chryseobacterium jejuense]
MKYYKINFKTFSDIDRIASNASGEEIPNAEYYFNSMRDGQIIKGLPTLDYFYLESFDKKEFWEWKLLDVHKFFGIAGLIDGWLISKKMKSLLCNFNIPEEHYFYPSKLLYKGEKLDYFVFQFYGRKISDEVLKYINFEKSVFWNPVNNTDVLISKQEDFYPEYMKIYKENKSLSKAMGIKKNSVIGKI